MSPSPYSLSHQPGRDRHGHELLEKELARVGQHHLHNLGPLARVLAALKRLVLEVGHRDEPAGLAHVDAIGVGLVHETLLEERRGAVGDDAIALHLSEAQTAVPRPTLHRLAGQDLHRAAAARVDLIVHHVLKPLVVRGPEEDLSLELSSRVAVVHDLVAPLLVTALVEHVGDALDGDWGEGGGVALLAHHRRNLTHETLDELPDGHARRDGVGVDDDVRHDTLARERHVLLGVRHADGTLLPVPGRKLVANLRGSAGSHADLDEPQALVVRGE